MLADRPTAHAILVVDDNDDIREAMEIAFRSHGFAVATAGDALAALRRIRDGFDPCALLLDLHMPGLSGWHVLDHKDDDRDLSDVAVIVISGDAEQRERALGRGCEFLLKPVRPELLFATIERRCRQHRVAREGPVAPSAPRALRTPLA